MPKKAGGIAAKREGMLVTNLAGREAANPDNLSRSYGVPIERVKALMGLYGVKEDG